MQTKQTSYSQLPSYEYLFKFKISHNNLVYVYFKFYCNIPEKKALKPGIYCVKNALKIPD